MSIFSEAAAASGVCTWLQCPGRAERHYAGLVSAALDSGLREALGLDDASRVIAVGSEGATDPETFKRVVGRPREEIRG